MSMGTKVVFFEFVLFAAFVVVACVIAFVPRDLEQYGTYVSVILFGIAFLFGTIFLNCPYCGKSMFIGAWLSTSLSLSDRISNGVPERICSRCGTRLWGKAPPDLRRQ